MSALVDEIVAAESPTYAELFSARKRILGSLDHFRDATDRLVRENKRLRARLAKR